jgi:hypothetical protein
MLTPIMTLHRACLVIDSTTPADDHDTEPYVKIFTADY